MMNRFKALGWSQKASVVAMLLVLMVLPLSLFLVYSQTRLGSQAMKCTPGNQALVNQSACRACCTSTQTCVGVQSYQGCARQNSACKNGVCCYSCRGGGGSGSNPAGGPTTTPSNCNYTSAPSGASCCTSTNCIGHFYNAFGCPAQQCGGGKYYCSKCKSGSDLTPIPIPTTSSAPVPTGTGIPPNPTSTSAPTPVVGCSDTDGGINLTSRGTVTTSYGSYTDFCSQAGSLVEYYCTDDHLAQNETVTCPNGCQDGRCITSAAGVQSVPIATPTPPDAVCKSQGGVCCRGPKNHCVNQKLWYGDPYYSTQGGCSPSGVLPFSNFCCARCQ